MRHAAIIMIAGLILRVSEGFFITKAFGANGCQKIRSRDGRIKGVKIHKLDLTSKQTSKPTLSSKMFGWEAWEPTLVHQPVKCPS
jgi:hypothetical protein